MTNVWLVGYYPTSESSVEIGGVFSTREKARKAAWKATGRHPHVFFGPLGLDETLPLSPADWEGVEWVTRYDFLIVGDWEASSHHDEHYWGPLGGNILQTNQGETHRRLSCIDRTAPTAAWLCKSANDYNWQELTVMLGMRNIPIHPLNCDHE